MSIIVDNLTKLYGQQRAVDQISFEAKPGEVLGFLGPNGAGKTTTMKIITCFIPPSEGRVEVCGHSIGQDPLPIQRRIGYLPEHNPLYLDMYVKEYLTFIARLHRVRQPRHRVAELVQLTGLQKEQGKLISALSKGYRQRVGLAQAMMHDPDVLILDEPTSGLDPNQLLEIRKLIKQLAADKTVIFSTHIMQEVQAICDRVLIINNGQIVANDPIEQLQDRIRGEAIVTVGFQEHVERELLLRLSGVTRVKELADGRWQVFADKATDLRPDLFHFAVAQQLTLIEMQQENITVEDVFQRLTQQERTHA